MPNIWRRWNAYTKHYEDYDKDLEDADEELDLDPDYLPTEQDMYDDPDPLEKMLEIEDYYDRWAAGDYDN